MKNRNIKHSDNWKTLPGLYQLLDKEFGFDFDPCPYSENEPALDGLSIYWGDVNFCNPPYSRKLKESFVLKGIEQWKKGKTVVFLLPVSTSTKLFHDVILPNNPVIRFIKGRVAFQGYNTKGERIEKNKGIHDSMLVIFKA